MYELELRFNQDVNQVTVLEGDLSIAGVTVACDEGGATTIIGISDPDVQGRRRLGPVGRRVWRREGIIVNGIKCVGSHLPRYA